MYPLQSGANTIILVDTPGFNDTERSDSDILLEIQDWLKTTFSNTKLLSAILYFHPISDTRFQGSSRRGLDLFKQLLGQESYKNVLLVSTFWNQVPGETCFMREKELTEMTEGWKTLIDGGARVERMGRVYDRFLPILRDLIKLGPMQLVESTTAALSLLDLRAEQDAKLSEVKQGLKKQLEDQHQARTVAVREHYEKELERQRRENEAVAAKLRELTNTREKQSQDEHQPGLTQLERELATRARWARNKDMLEDASRALLDLSEKQLQQVEDAIEQLRAIFDTNGRSIPEVWEIRPGGLGMFELSAGGGKDLRRYSVTRNGLNTWCDACRFPIGAKVRYCKYQPSVKYGDCLSSRHRQCARYVKQDIVIAATSPGSDVRTATTFSSATAVSEWNPSAADSPRPNVPWCVMFPTARTSSKGFTSVCHFLLNPHYLHELRA